MKWCAWMSLLLAFHVQAGEQQMQQALSEWQQQLAEYRAAASLAAEGEELTPPSPEEIAPKLWRAVSGVTGRKMLMSTDKKKKREVPSYEFEEAWAAPAVIWLLQYPDAFAKVLANKPKEVPYFAQRILDSVYNKHYSAPGIAEACPKLAESASDQGYKILEKIYEQNKDPKARSCAALALSIYLGRPTMATAEGGYARTHSKRIYYLKQALNIAPGDTMFGSATLTEVAEEQIYRLRVLSNGSIPPRMTLTDPQNKSKMLFPREGKPNLIFFWSPAEEVGLGMMSKQESLRKRYPGLVLCPVIPAGEEAEVTRILQESGISTCYMDDEQGTAGKAYRVSQLPLAVLVDARARILYIGYPDMQLQSALENLFSAEQTAPTARPRSAPTQPPPQGSDIPPTLREMPQF